MLSPRLANKVWCHNAPKDHLRDQIRDRNMISSRNNGSIVETRVLRKNTDIFDVSHYTGVLTQMQNNDMMLKKTATGSNRLLFVAGLEGTGHHALAAMFGACIKSKFRDIRCEFDRYGG